ncbi:MAG TPA: hypothetical protein VF062_00745 [Candidatus Limnocylindrales bacterium]
MTLAERRNGPVLGGPGDLHMTWKTLAGGARSCAEVLIDIAQNERAPSASRVTAAKTVLEMVGFKTPDVVPILPPDVDPAGAPAGAGESPSARIRSRIASLAAASRAGADDEIADAEIVVVDDEGHEVIDAVIEDGD